MTPGEVAVVGLGASGVASTRLLRREHRAVYVSDAGTGPALEARAADLRALGATVDLGHHDLARIAAAERVVASPGVPPDAAPLRHARACGVSIISEVELGLAALPNARVIAISGTNGKTTVTGMVEHLLRALDQDVAAVGNIGTPVCEVALRAVPPTWLALEISSFQLHDSPSLSPAVGVLTNLSPDHLDRYPSVAAYYADKALLFQHAHAASRWVVNGDDPASLDMVADVPGARATFRTSGAEGDAWLDRSRATLVVQGAPLLAAPDLPLLGAHNIANALAATLAVMVADPAYADDDARRRLASALRTFRAPSHRLEVVGEFGGVIWINDSKATNVASTRVALESMTRPTVLLLGGRHKGEPYTSLRSLIRTHCSHVLAYGEATGEIVRDLGGPELPVEPVAGDFAAVMRRARAAAAPGGAVLLSPACSSYDMFNNYQERGAAFGRAAREGTP